MKIYITRHGQTNWNFEHKVQGTANIPLNETGKKQAEETRKKLENKDIDLIICSPLERAKKTAEIINQNKKVPILYDERIAERCFGNFEGKKQEEFDFLSYWDYEKNRADEEVEKIQDFFCRINSFLDEALVKYAGKNILLVCHGGVSVPVSCYFCGFPKDRHLLELVLNNCEYAEYSWKEGKEDE